MIDVENYYRLAVSELIRTPENKKDYLEIRGRYWPIDTEGNVFLTKIYHGVCAESRQTANHYARRMQLPVKIYRGRERGNRIALAWIEVGWIRRRVRLGKYRKYQFI